MVKLWHYCFVKDPVIYDILHVLLDFPVEVNVFGTSIWDEGKARLIMGLPKLRQENSLGQAFGMNIISIWDEGKARLIMGLPKLRQENSFWRSIWN
jgi:hypothetical protein